MKQVLSVFANEIKKYFNKSLKSASYDVTKDGIVTAVLGGNKYSIKIEGTVYTVPSAISDTFNVNDVVLVTYFQNDAKKKYITGKAAV